MKPISVRSVGPDFTVQLKKKKKNLMTNYAVASRTNALSLLSRKLCIKVETYNFVT